MLKLKSTFNLFLFIFLFTLSNNAYSFTTLYKVFSDNMEHCFIEMHNTGNGEAAIYDALALGFPKIFIADVTQYAYERNVELFGGYPNITIDVGNPDDLLANFLNKCKKGALIFFDGTSDVLVIKELRKIEEINSNQNTLIIERFEEYPRDTQKLIIKIIKKINPSYSISRKVVFGYGTVLIAKIKDKKPKDHSSSDSHHHCSSDKHCHHSSSDKHCHHSSSDKHHHHKHK